jgi:hypothetical protein
MFKKLSAALVAISLVAVAQPASAQDGQWTVGQYCGNNCPKFPEQKYQIIIKSIDGKKVLATDGKSYAVPKSQEVSVDGVQVAPEELKPGMACEVNQGKPFFPRNIFTCKTS